MTAKVFPGVVPAKAGTHTPCPLGRLRRMGPGSSAGTTETETCHPPGESAEMNGYGRSPYHDLFRPDMLPVVGRLASRDTLPPDHPTIPPPRFERNTVDAAAPKPSTVSCIGADMSITGRVECAGEVRVFGRIVGPLRAAGVLIGDGGAIEGDVVAQEVTSRGRIAGTVRAARVRLQGHAMVAGDIVHQSLAIEEFVLFEGASRLLGPG
jgi:cytoskeletal protein CcmA (bactofilin family)